MTDDLLWRHLRDVPAFRALLRATEARFYADLPLTEPVLDVGCGDGHFGAVALPRPPQVGLDPDARSLQEAHRRGVYSLLVQADGGRMPFPDGFFATVVSNSVLEHIPAVESVLGEIARVLRPPDPEAGTPGGEFYFSVPGPNFLPFLSIGRALDRIGLGGLGDTYRRFFNRVSRHHHCDGPATWRQRLRRVGLRLVHWCSYFSRRAVAALEWGHYLGIPSLVSKRLTGRWVLCPVRANLWLTERLIRPIYREPLPEEGAYFFFVAERVDGET